MPVMTKITTLAVDAINRLIAQFKDKPKLEAFLNAVSSELQAFEDASFELNSLLDIDLMEGAQLDGIGTIVVEPRQGKSDAAYRIAIRQKIAANAGSGEPESVITAFIVATSPTGAVDYIEDYPAGFIIYGDGSQPANLQQTIEAAAPAGVYVGLLDFLIWEDSDDALWEDSDTIYVVYSSSGG